MQDCYTGREEKRRKSAENEIEIELASFTIFKLAFPHF